MRKDITVIAKMQPDKTIIPLSLIWENGQIYEIDKVVSIDKKASVNGGGMGLRYTCKINGHTKYIWLDDKIWFVEINSSFRE